MNRIAFKAVIFFLLLSFSPFFKINSQDKDIWFTTILKEKFTDKNGNTLTGKGVVIGDIDAGVDIFNPMFFFADGGEYDWIDINNDGVFTPGVDAVMIDGKQVVLNYIEMKDNTASYFHPAYLRKSPGSFVPDLDFLYADANNNGKRDYGEASGFTEQTPTYGEQLFIAIDANHNGKLDAGEKIVALKTSKVRAIREKDGVIRRRGIDLIKSNVEGVDHGTGVSGIILGGHYGVQRLHGFAPDAELVMAKVNYNYTPRFVSTFPDLIRFIKSENVNIMLYEDGEWSWEYMDGSTEEEQLADELARSGITVIGAAGNLATGNMHILDTLLSGQSREYQFKCPAKVSNKKNDGAFVQYLWKGDDKNLSFKVKTPDNSTSEVLGSGSGFITVGKYHIFYSKDESSRGTNMFRFGFSEKDSNAVNGNWSITVSTDKDVILNGYLVDISQEWGYISKWDSPKLSDISTITFPSTGDSVIIIGAYAVNTGWGEKVGDLCTYSGIGPTFSYNPGVIICAPGHTTFTTGVGYSYQQFSGTSSAAPHAVGVAALLLQYNPNLTHSDIKRIFVNSAATDNFTGSVPNAKWGYGKLNAEGAIKFAIENY